MPSDSEIGAVEIANGHYRAGRIGEAERICREILERNPKNSAAWHVLGMIASDSGRTGVAADYFERAVAADPNSATLRSNLGELKRRLGRLDEAVEQLRIAVGLNPEFGDAWNNLADILSQQGKIDEAIAAYVKAAELQPRSAMVQHRLGVAYWRKGEHGKSAAAFQRAVTLNPDSASLFFDLGIALQTLWRNAEAVEAFDKAIALNPKAPGPYTAKAASLIRMGHLVEAETCVGRAIEIGPEDAGAYNQLGILRQMQGKWPESLAAMRKSIALKADDPAVHTNYARMLLLTGNLKEGWEEFEWRHEVPSLGLNRGFPQPQWDGSDLAGLTILVHAEGGHGDALQFARFVPRIAGRGAKVIVECQPALVSLMRSIRGVDIVVARGEPLPEFDVHIPLLGLPRIFGVTLDQIPNEVPYVTAPADLVAGWAERLAGQTKLRVGLAWCGSDCGPGDNRTRSLEIFSPLAGVQGVKFFSLQTGPASGQGPLVGADWADFSGDIRDFADLAALTRNLDLVISVDTSIAHLAGALAKPVWVLIPFVPDFRWLTGRADSPWYPTMRLFRQKSAADWTAVIQELTQALRAEVRKPCSTEILE